MWPMGCVVHTEEFSRLHLSRTVGKLGVRKVDEEATVSQVGQAHRWIRFLGVDR
jgi:hypothetical protein